MKRPLIALLAAVAVGIAGWFVWHPAPTAPDVAFKTLDGKTITMADLRGKVVLVKFWATDCVTCMQQMPATVADYRHYEPKGYVTMAVAMSYDKPSYVENYTQTRKLPFPVALDSQGKLAQAFGDVRLTPTAFLIDRKGHIVKRYLGEYDPAQFHAAVEKALAG
jgi:peroxiredoxin